MDHSILEILNSRTERLPGQVYKLMGSHTPDQFGMDVVIPDNLDVDEGEMSVVIPFADGRRRDGVGDLLEVGGINTERHIKNPIVLFDHGKKVDLPIGLTEDPQTKEYLVSIDPVLKQARAKAFFYQGNGNLTGISPRGGPTKEYDHALFCEQLFDLVSKRFIRAGSIGYQVINAKHLMPDYEFGTPQGLHLLSVRMLEVSVVVMPANQDTVSKCLSLTKLCGKPLSPYLVKSLAPYAPAKKAQMGYEGQKAQGMYVMPNNRRVYIQDADQIKIDRETNRRLAEVHPEYIETAEITNAEEQREAREARGEKGQKNSDYSRSAEFYGFDPKSGASLFPSVTPHYTDFAREVVRDADEHGVDINAEPYEEATRTAYNLGKERVRKDEEARNKSINPKPILPSESDEKVEYKISNESKERQQNTAKQNQTRLSNMRKEREAKGEKKLDAVVEPPLKDASYTGRIPPPEWKPGVGAVKAVVNPSTPPSPVGPRVSAGDTSSVSEIQAVHNIAADQKTPPTGEPQQKAQADVGGVTIKDQDEEKRSNTRALSSYNATPPLTDEAERHYESIPKPGPMSEQKQLATQATGQLGFKLDKVKQKSLRAKYAPQAKASPGPAYDPDSYNSRPQRLQELSGGVESVDLGSVTPEEIAAHGLVEHPDIPGHWVPTDPYYTSKATGGPGYDASQGNVYNDPDYIDLDQTTAEALEAAYPTTSGLPVSQDPDRWTVSDFEIYDLPDTDEKAADNEQVAPTIKQDLPYVEMQKPLRAARDENYHARELQRNIQKLEEANRIREEIRNYPKPAINGPRVEASDDDWLGAYSHLDYPEYEIPEQEKAIPLVESRGRKIRAADRRDQNQASKPQGRRDAYGNVVNSQGEVTSGSTMKAPTPRPTAGPNMQSKNIKGQKGKALTPEEKVRYYTEASEINPELTEYGVDFTDKTGREAWRAVNEGRMSYEDYQKRNEDNYENYLRKPPEEKGLGFDTPVDEASSMKAYEPRVGEYVTALPDENQAGQRSQRQTATGPLTPQRGIVAADYGSIVSIANEHGQEVLYRKDDLHKGKALTPEESDETRYQAELNYAIGPQADEDNARNNKGKDPRVRNQIDTGRQREVGDEAVRKAKRDSRTPKGQKAYEPRESEQITYLQHEDNAGSDFAIRGPASIDPSSRRSVFINTHDPATNEPVQVPVPKSQIHKGKSVKDLRAKYAAPKELAPNKVKIMRHKTLGAKQGNSMVYMDEKDLPKAREHAKQCGLVMELAGQLSDGRAKVRVRGFDDAIDSLAQRFGTAPAKSGKKNCKSLPKQPKQESKAAPRKGDRISGSYNQGYDSGHTIGRREPNNPNFDSRQIQGEVTNIRYDTNTGNEYYIGDINGDYLRENEIDEIEPGTEEKAFDEEAAWAEANRRYYTPDETGSSPAAEDYFDPNVENLLRAMPKYGSPGHEEAVRNHYGPLRDRQHAHYVNKEVEKARSQAEGQSDNKGVPNPINPGPRADHDRRRSHHGLKELPKQVKADDRRPIVREVRDRAQMPGVTKRETPYGTEYVDKTDMEREAVGLPHQTYSMDQAAVEVDYGDTGESWYPRSNYTLRNLQSAVDNQRRAAQTDRDSGDPVVEVYPDAHKKLKDLTKMISANQKAIEALQAQVKELSGETKSDDFDEPDILAERRALSRSYNADHAIPVNSNYYTEHREGIDPRATERARDHKESYIHRHMRDQS